MVKKVKKKNRRDTQKKKKLIRLISVNFGIKGFTKSMYKMMREAGYSESSARQYSLVLSGIREELEAFSSQMERARTKAMKELDDEATNRFKAANLRDLINAIDVLTKNIELLKGRPTERTGREYTPEQLKRFHERRSKELGIQPRGKRKTD